MKTAIFLCFTIWFTGNALAGGVNAGVFPFIPPRSAAAPEHSGSEVNRRNALSDSEKIKIAKFVNANRPHDVMEILPVNVVDFGRASVGGGKSDFLVLFDFSERGYSNRLWVYSRDGAGALKIQEIEGWKMGPLKQMVQDLNGDGTDELIIPMSLGGGSWTPTPATPVWTAIYRLENGRYVDDSRDFANYYDAEVLPQLDKAITAAKSQGYADGAAMDILEKNKILRVLGRDPVAGLSQAYQWMNSDNPILLQCAVATFGDIGGHDKEVRALRQALPAAIKHEIEARKGG